MIFTRHFYGLSSYCTETVSNKSLAGSDTAFTYSGCFEWKKNPQPVCCVRATEVPPRVWRRAEPSTVQFECTGRCLEETKRATMNGLGRELFLPGAVHRIQWIQVL